MVGPITDAEKLRARVAFVAKVKEDDAHRDTWFKTSLKAHWTGPLGGFASDGANRRWDDFLSGWKAAKTAAMQAQAQQDEALIRQMLDAISDLKGYRVDVDAAIAAARARLGEGGRV